MTTPSFSEYQAYGPGRQELAYVPTTPIPGYNHVELWRLISKDAADHMDSLYQYEATSTYNSEGVIGYPFKDTLSPDLSSAIKGLSPLARYNNGVDHGTSANGIPIVGYSYEGPLYTVDLSGAAYVFPLFQNYSDASMTLTSGLVSITSDFKAGGAIRSWKYRNPNNNNIYEEFIDATDFGRYMQSDFFFSGQTQPGKGTAETCFYNPIEAGERLESNGLVINRTSRAISVNQSDSSQSTRTTPVDYHGYIIDADEDHVRFYHSTQIGKDLQVGSGALNNVTMYQTVFSLPNALHIDTSEVPVAWLNARFERLFEFDGRSPADRSTFDWMNEASSSINSCNGDEVEYHPDSGYGGVIASTSDGSLAMGFYAYSPFNVNGNPAGSITSFTIDTYKNCNQNVKAISARAKDMVLPAGTTAFRVYVINGTITEVKNVMRLFYSNNVR